MTLKTWMDLKPGDLIRSKISGAIRPILRTGKLGKKNRIILVPKILKNGDSSMIAWLDCSDRNSFYKLPPQNNFNV